MKQENGIHFGSSEVNKCLLCFDPECTKACPQGADVGGILRSIYFRNPMGAVKKLTCDCASCDAPCEKACALTEKRQPPAIRTVLLNVRRDRHLLPGHRIEKIDLSTDICGVRLENPFLLSSSVVASSYDMCRRAFEAGWAGIDVYDGGLITGTTANVGSGYLNVSSGGSAENTIFSDNWYWGGHMNVYDGASVTGTTITAGYLRIFAGGAANDTLVVGGEAIISGTVTDLSVTGGGVHIYDGGLLTGQISISDGGRAMPVGALGLARKTVFPMPQ